MNIDQMIENYRTIRKNVFNEATMPLNKSPLKRKENQQEMKKQISILCIEAQLDRYKGTDHNAAKRLWNAMWTVIRYAGIKSQIAEKEIQDIIHIFNNYNEFQDSKWNLQRNGHTINSAGTNVDHFLKRTGIFTGKQTVGNLPKLEKTIKLARALSDFMEKKQPTQPVLDFVTGGNPATDVWKIHDHLQKIGYTKDLTALHFMMDIGFPVMKPDIVITRLFFNLGWLHQIVPNLPSDLHENDLQGDGKYKSRYSYQHPRMFKPVIDLSQKISSMTNQDDLKTDIGWVTSNPLREFDIFMVKYGQEPDGEFGIERNLFKELAKAKTCQYPKT